MQFPKELLAISVLALVFSTVVASEASGQDTDAPPPEDEVEGGEQDSVGDKVDKADEADAAQDRAANDNRPEETQVEGGGIGSAETDVASEEKDPPRAVEPGPETGAPDESIQSTDATDEPEQEPPAAEAGDAQMESSLLEMSLEELLDMQVTTASKDEEKLSDAPGMITVVTKDEIRRFGGVTLKDILNRVPSLIVSTTYFSDRTTIASRGDQIRMDSGHILVLINGRPTRETLEGGVSSEVFEAFPIDIIERIEIIKGPGSVLYGSNAFSAVINIITKKNTNSTSLKAMAGVPLSHGESAASTVTIGDLSLSAAGLYLKRADWNTTYRYSPPDSVDTVTTDISIPDDKAGAYFGASYKGLSLDAMYNQWHHSYFYEGTVGKNRWRRAFGDIGYRLTVSEKLRWEMDFHATYTFAAMKSSDYPDIDRKSHDIIGEWTNFVRLLDNLRLVVGGLYDYVRGKEIYSGTAADLTVSDKGRPSGAFYAQLDYQPWKILSLIAGMQLNKIKGVDADVVPRGGIILNPIPELNFKVLYGQAYRAPSINEMSLRHPDLWGNPDLRPEKVQTVDAGVGYLGKNITLGVNYFFTRQKDIIMVDTSPSTRFNAPTYYANLGEVQIQGVEFEGKYYILKNLFLTASALYFFSKDGDDNENITPIPNAGAKGGVSYMDEKGITVSVFYIFQGKLDNAYSARLNPDPDPYHLLNTHCSFDFARFFKLKAPEGLGVFMEGQNLLNQKIFLPDWGGVIGETIPANPGLTLFFGISGALAYNTHR